MTDDWFWFPPLEEAHDLGLLGYLVLVVFQLVALTCVAVVFVAPVVVFALWLFSKR